MGKELDLHDVAATSKLAQRQLHRLLEWIRQEGERNDVCTYDILEQVCPYCRCKRSRKEDKR